MSYSQITPICLKGGRSPKDSSKFFQEQVDAIIHVVPVVWHFRQLELSLTTQLLSMPQPGNDQSSLQFGDWLTLTAPLVGDISSSSREWWMEVLTETAALYDQWR